MVEPLDLSGVVNTEGSGRTLAEGLELVLGRERLSLPEPVTVLFLGAGSARAELAYASQLGIGPNKLTLVDRYNASSKARLEAVGFVVVSEDMFNFMEKTRYKFSLVGGLGIEDVVEKWPEEFFTNLARVVKSGGVVHLSASPEVDVSYWENQGFREIGGRVRLILVKD